MFAKTGSLIAGMVVLSVAGCSSTEPSGTGATTVRTSVASGPVDFAKIPGQIPAEAEMTQQGSEEAPIGACVYLKGKPGSVTLNKVDCDSQDANYRVIQRVGFPDQCVNDADRRFYLGSPQGEWTACMDYAWTSEGCISVAPDKVVQAECDDKNLPNRERPITILFNTIDTSRCLFGGFAHPVRRFTVCTETQK